VNALKYLDNSLVNFYSSSIEFLERLSLLTSVSTSNNKAPERFFTMTFVDHHVDDLGWPDVVVALHWRWTRERQLPNDVIEDVQCVLRNEESTALFITLSHIREKRLLWRHAAREKKSIAIKMGKNILHGDKRLQLSSTASCFTSFKSARGNGAIGSNR